MSDKIGNNRPVNFNNAYAKSDKKSTDKTAETPCNEDIQQSTNLGEGVYGRAQVRPAFLGTPQRTANDIAYFKENPELVSFCGEIFDHYSNNGASYLEAVEKSLECGEVFRKID